MVRRWSGGPSEWSNRTVRLRRVGRGIRSSRFLYATVAAQRGERRGMRRVFGDLRPLIAAADRAENTLTRGRPGSGRTRYGPTGL